MDEDRIAVPPSLRYFAPKIDVKPPIKYKGKEYHEWSARTAQKWISTLVYIIRGARNEINAERPTRPHDHRVEHLFLNALRSFCIGMDLRAMLNVRSIRAAIIDAMDHPKSGVQDH